MNFGTTAALSTLVYFVMLFVCLGCGKRLPMNKPSAPAVMNETTSPESGDSLPPTPTCVLTPVHSSIAVGATLTLTLKTSHATSAAIDGELYAGPASLTRVATAPGSFTVVAQVMGPGGSGSCDATYTVTSSPTTPVPKPPTCTLTASPTPVRAGESVTLSISVTNATGSSFDGHPFSNSGKATIRTTTPGNFTAIAIVTGPGGSGVCPASYRVTSPPPPPPTATPISPPPQPTKTPSPVPPQATKTPSPQPTQAPPTQVPQPTVTPYQTPPPQATKTPSPQPTQAPPTLVPQPTRTPSPVPTQTPPPTQTPLPPPPIQASCTLAASPPSVEKGGNLTLVLSAANATSASDRENHPFAVPTGQVRIVPTATGSFTSIVDVTGPGGSGSCEAEYTVTEPPIVPCANTSGHLTPSAAGTISWNGATYNVYKVSRSIAQLDAVFPGWHDWIQCAKGVDGDASSPGRALIRFTRPDTGALVTISYSFAPVGIRSASCVGVSSNGKWVHSIPRGDGSGIADGAASGTTFPPADLPATTIVTFEQHTKWSHNVPAAIYFCQ